MVQAEGLLHPARYVLQALILLGVQLACHVLEEHIHHGQELHLVITVRQASIQQEALLLATIVLLDLLQ